MRTVAAVYKKYGRYLTEPLTQAPTQPAKEQNKPMSFIKTDFKISALNFKVSQNLNLIPGLFQLTKSIARLDNLTCAMCQSDFKVEMHHVRAMKDLNPKISGVDRLMVERRRKQIPLCRPCHMKHHFGTNNDKTNTPLDASIRKASPY
jgi:hypothetical protein